MKILILCTGNSCRSQMAQAFLSTFDASLQVFSAGTNPVEAVNVNAVAVMKEVGLDISGRRPCGVTQYLAEPWDYVITVCGGANESCPAFAGRVRHRVHLGFDDPVEAKEPLNYVLSEFRRIRDEIKDGFYAFYLEELRPNL